MIVGVGRRLCAAWGAALVIVSCAGEGEPDPRTAFTRAAESLETIDTVGYEFRFVPRDDPYYEHRLEGTATVRRLDLSGSHFEARAKATVTAPGEEPYEIEVIRGRDVVGLLDHRSRTLMESPVAAFGNRLQAKLDPALLYAFFDPVALGSEAEAETVVWEGRGDIAGEACRWVRVGYADDDEDSRWCLAERDGLPRALEIFSATGRRTLEIADLRVDPTLGPSIFEISAPPGYESVEAAFGPAKGSKAEPWTLETLDGGEVSLASLRGTVVVLDFFATWCPPCPQSMLSLQEHLKEFAGRPVRGFAVNALETREPTAVAAFLGEIGVTYPLLLAGDAVHASYAQGALPAVVVLDAEGRHVGLANGYFGERSDRYVRELIEEALDATGS